VLDPSPLSSTVRTERAPVVVATARFASPVGDLAAYTHQGALCALSFVSGRYDPLAALSARLGPVQTREGDPLDVRGRFRDYFRGQLDALDGIPVDTGGTPFQRRVWEALRTIPVGTTLSYLEMARRVGAPHAVRAVGAANGANPVAIVLPCHRVIGSNGRLVGYGGGLDRKRWLLAHEKAPLSAAAGAQARLFE
jgi:methylated-DNA-[protein]-cysteine S-methyltransferase